MTTRILLVEDDAISQDLIRALCESRGFAVDVAADGFRGLKLLSEGRHTVALIDYHLPEMDGYALARLMREFSVGRDADLKLVGITADRDGLALRRGADALFDAILHKPLDPPLLFAALDRLLAPSDPADAALVRAKAFLSEPDAGRAVAAADAFWRRRGLDRLPRAVACPVPTGDQAAALGLCFALVPRAQDADLALILDASGLEPLRALRSDPATCLVPAIDLTGRLGAACEAAFRIDDAETWTAVARLLRDVADRRGRLVPVARRPIDAGIRLLAMIFVSGALVLRRADDAGVAASIETGLGTRGLVATLADLHERGLVVCAPSPLAIEVALSEQGLQLLTSEQERPAMPPVSRPPAEETALRARVDALLDPALVPGEDPWSTMARSLLREYDRMSRPAADPLADGGGEPMAENAGLETEHAAVKQEAGVVHALGIEDEAPILNRRKIEELGALIGADNVASLRARLTEQLRSAFQETGRPAGLLAQEAHVLISIAGMLGCDRLSWACTRLEQASKTGGSLDAPLATARALRDQTLVVLTAQG